MSQVALKCVLVGDSSVGKTSLLNSLAQEEKSEEKNNDQIVLHFTINNENINLTLWDTKGSSDYDRLRPLSYPNSDIIIICYQINNIKSFENITKKWLPEIKHHSYNSASIFVLGCQKDKINFDESFVSMDLLDEFRKNNLGVIKGFDECSKNDRKQNLVKIFEDFVYYSGKIGPVTIVRNRRCVIL